MLLVHRGPPRWRLWKVVLALGVLQAVYLCESLFLLPEHSPHHHHHYYGQPLLTDGLPIPLISYHSYQYLR